MQARKVESATQSEITEETLARHLNFETWEIDRITSYARNPRRND
jgi:hypothetical protein